MIRKGINIWSFDPRADLGACFEIAKDAGFEGVELALSADGPVGLKITDQEALAIRRRAEDLGMSVSGLATGLYWQYSITSERADIREKALQVAKRQLEIAALLGADAALVCPGAVGVDFQPNEVVPDASKIEYFVGSEVIDYEVAYVRARDAFIKLAVHARSTGVKVGVENIWNKFLLSPLEMRSFIDEIHSEYVGVWLDVANMMMFGYPEQWIRILGQRIVKVHFKDFRRDVKSLSGFVDLLSGDVDWQAVKRALDTIGYDGWANGEMCPTYKQYTNQMVYNCSQAMDLILERKKPAWKY